MKKNKDLELLRERLDKENITAPDSLTERIEDGMEHGGATILPLEKINKKSHKGLRRTLAVAACVAVAVTSVMVGNAYKNYPRVDKTDKPAYVNESGTELSGITYFKSYDEIGTLFEEIDKRQDYAFRSTFRYSGLGSFISKSDEVAESADGVAAVTNDTSAPSHAETNKQVDAVDESDIIKTDATHIYYIPNAMDRVIIFSAVNGKTEKLAEIKGERYEFFHEMFLAEGKLIIIGTHESGYAIDYYDDIVDGSETKAPEKNEYYTFVRTYDITDDTDPRLTDEYRQSGSFLSARMMNGIVYLVTNDGYYYTYDQIKYGEDFIPCATNSEGVYEQLPVDSICGVTDTDAKSYAVLGAVDIATGENAQKTKAVLGIGNEIYCNENNLYLTGVVNEWGKKRTAVGEVYDRIINEKTQIVKYSLNGLEMKPEASGTVEGRIDNQFSMDEYKGNFRIATTSYSWYSGAAKDTNNLFVLDKELKELGSVTGFARDEHIEAVRFMGDTAYVITYVQIDPLFVIDLSNPKKPEIKGEVEIEGFSSSLTPIDENTLLGIGYATADNGYGGERSDGVKIVIFDVSNKEKPKVAAEKAIPDSWSTAQENHKAIVRNAEAGYFAIPITVYDDGSGQDNSGALVITPKGHHLTLKSYTTGKDTYPDRVTYIGDYLYVSDPDHSTFHSFSLTETAEE